MSKKALILIFLVISLSSAALSNSENQETSNKAKKKQLKPHTVIVVTATKTRKAVKDCSASVSVVDEVDLKATAASNAMNLLSHLPGLFIRKTGDFGRSDVDIRGLGQNLNKFKYYLTFDRRLSDGHRENSGYTGNAFTGKMIFNVTEGLELSLRSKYFSGRKHEAGSIEYPLTDFWNDYERGAIDFSLKSDGDKDEILLKVYRNFGHHQFSGGSYPMPKRNVNIGITIKQ